MKNIFLFLALTLQAFAGVSITVYGSNIPQVNMASGNKANPWRIETAIHDWPAAPTVNTVAFGASYIGVQAVYVPESGTGKAILQVQVEWDTSGGNFNIPLDSSLANAPADPFASLRIQRDPTGVCGTPKTEYLEVFDRHDNRLLSVQNIYTGNASWNFPGFNLGGGQSEATSIVYWRHHDTLICPGGPAPKTFDNANRVHEYKFDALNNTGTLQDDVSPGTGSDLTVSPGISTCSGTITTTCYSITPLLYQGSNAIIKTMNAPAWSTWVSLRAGRSGQLDGSASGSQSDTSSAVNYFWQQLSGPSTVTWSSRTAAQPLIKGLVFGTYVFQLTVTGANGTQSASTLTVGAVAQDSKCNVINADPRIETILGPAKAYGCGAWPYIDDSQRKIGDWWSRNYSIDGDPTHCVSGGTGCPWFLEPDLASFNGVPRLGTVYAANGGTTINGVGTNFKAVFGCASDNSSPTDPGAGYFLAVHIPVGSGIPYYDYPRQVVTCVSDTQVTIKGGWNQATITSPGVSWGTYLGCAFACGDWRYTNRTPSDIFFYDSPEAFYSSYFRSGYARDRDAARWGVDRWIHAPELAFQLVPRDVNGVGEMIRAAIDPAGAANLWPAIRSWLDGTCANTTNTLTNPREAAYCLIQRAVQAMLDTGSDQTAALAWLSTEYTNLWGSQQQADGSYINDEFEGDSQHAFSFTNGSAVGTLVSGSSLTSTYDATTNPRGGSRYCFEDVLFTNTGSISIGMDRATVTGTGTNFTGSAGMLVQLRGMSHGVAWSMASQVAASPAPTSTSMTLAFPWRGDLPASITAWRILTATSTPPHGEQSADMYFAKTDATNNGGIAVPSSPPYDVDTDSWYWCTITDGTHILLDKPYTGNTSSGNIYRRATWQNLPGRGMQPFHAGIAAIGLKLAANATATSNPTLSVNFMARMDALVAWGFAHGYDSTTGGFYFGSDGFSNCKDISFPALECSGGSATEERGFAVEFLHVCGQHYLNTGNPADKMACESLAKNLFASDSYTNPAAGDGTTLNTFLYATDYNQTKGFGQVWSIGQVNAWSTIRDGGVDTLTTRTIYQGFHLPAGASHAVFSITAPSGAQTQTTCTTSPCALTLDARQGDHLIVVQYKDVFNSVLATGDPTVIKVP